MKSRAPSGVLLISVGVSTSTKPLAWWTSRMAWTIRLRHHQPALHRLSSEVEVAVLESQALIDRRVRLVDVERRRLRLGQDRPPRSRGARSHPSAASRSRYRAGGGATCRPATATYSGRARLASACAAGASAGSITTWVIPWRSRRSRKISWPWSRRRWTQPARRALVPASVARWPQVCVR